MSDVAASNDHSQNAEQPKMLRRNPWVDASGHFL